MGQYNRTKGILHQLTSKIISHQVPVVNNVKHILVILTGTKAETEETLGVLIQGREMGFRYDLVFTEAAEDLLDFDKICQQLQPRKVVTEKKDPLGAGVLTGIDGIIVPVPTQNTAIKLALGIQDQLAPRLLWEALWRGIPLRMNLKALNHYKGSETKSISLQQMLNSYIEKLEGMGVKNIQGKDLLLEFELQRPPIVDHIPVKRVVLTEKDILKHPKEKKEIHVAYGSIITPQALDTARVLGIKIIKIKASN